MAPFGESGNEYIDFSTEYLAKKASQKEVHRQ